MNRKFQTAFINSFRISALSGVLIATGALAAQAGVGHSDGQGKNQSGGSAGTEAEVTRTIKIQLEDNYFDPEILKVQAGETIKFVLVNKGEFLHEFNIGTSEMHAKHQEEMAMMFEHGMLTPTGRNKDMSHGDMSKMKGMMGMKGKSMSHDDPNSKLVEPGDTAELIWRFAESKKLEFGCNIPGHYESGMVGQFLVETSAH